MTINAPVDTFQPKPPPEKPEAEASLLGSVLIDGSIYSSVVDQRLLPNDMTREPHRLVLEAMRALHERAEAIDYTTLTSEMTRAGTLASIGGPQFLVGLMQRVPTVAHADSYARVVERTAVLRKLIGAANEMARLALTSTDADDALSRAHELLFSVSQASIHREVLRLDVALAKYAEQIWTRAEHPKMGVQTGFATLDAKTGGLQPSDLIILAGRPSLGKSSFALSIVAHAAMVQGKVGAIFSLEMTEEMLAQRMISMYAEIATNRMRHGRLDLDELASISNASGRLTASPIFFDESTRLTVTDVLAKCRRQQAERGLDLVVIDYLQLLESKGNAENRVQEVAKITRSLKMIARELNVPVIALSQLSRQIETRGTEPMLSDLRESGAIEQDADLVLFLWRERTDKQDEVVRLKIAKHRNGPTGEIDFYFQGEFTRFRDLGEARVSP